MDGIDRRIEWSVGGRTFSARYNPAGGPVSVSGPDGQRLALSVEEWRALRDIIGGVLEDMHPNGPVAGGARRGRRKA